MYELRACCALCFCVLCVFQVCVWIAGRMSSTFVTLAEVLEARGGPLLEEEIWSLLLGAAECLMDVSYKGKAFQIASPFCWLTQHALFL